MKNLIVVFMILLMFPVVGMCNENAYLGDDPTPHAKWALERDGYTIIYDLENLLKRDDAKRQAIIEEAKKLRMIEAQDRQERIQL